MLEDKSSRASIPSLLVVLIHNIDTYDMTSSIFYWIKFYTYLVHFFLACLLIEISNKKKRKVGGGGTGEYQLMMVEEVQNSDRNQINDAQELI